MIDFIKSLYRVGNQVSNAVLSSRYCALCGRHVIDPDVYPVYGKPPLYLCGMCSLEYRRYLKLKIKFGGLE